MSLSPAFELGLWNAWIFMLPSLFISPLLLWLFHRDVWKDIAKKAGSSAPTYKRLGYAITIVFYVLVAYSFFLPLKLSTVWIYVGLCVFLPGVIFDIMAMISFAKTPLDKPVTRGIYRVSRNPIYFGQFLVCMGIGIACLSWIFLLYGAIFLIIVNLSVSAEERFCLEKYGDAYRKYMDRTPRWIGIPKSRDIV